MTCRGKTQQQETDEKTALASPKRVHDMLYATLGVKPPPSWMSGRGGGGRGASKRASLGPTDTNSLQELLKVSAIAAAAASAASGASAAGGANAGDSRSGAGGDGAGARVGDAAVVLTQVRRGLMEHQRVLPFEKQPTLREKTVTSQPWWYDRVTHVALSALPLRLSLTYPVQNSISRDSCSVDSGKYYEIPLVHELRTTVLPTSWNIRVSVAAEKHVTCYFRGVWFDANLRISVASPCPLPATLPPTSFWTYLLPRETWDSCGFRKPAALFEP